MDRKALPLSLALRRRLSQWAAKRKAKTNTLIRRKGDWQRAMRERRNPVHPFPRRYRYLLPPSKQTIIRFTCTSVDVVYFQPRASRLNI